jgi:hypothetical protein
MTPWQMFCIAALVWTSVDILAAQSGAGSAPDACTVLSRDEVMTLLGRKDLGRPRQQTGPDGDSTCRYPGRFQGSVAVALGTMSNAEFEAFRKSLVDEGKKPESVTGLGDGAFFWDESWLYALSGRTAVKVSISPTPGAQPAKTRADLLALARAIVARLKS